jgi:hypothetical protein
MTKDQQEETTQQKQNHAVTQQLLLDERSSKRNAIVHVFSRPLQKQNEKTILISAFLASKAASEAATLMSAISRRS